MARTEDTRIRILEWMLANTHTKWESPRELYHEMSRALRIPYQHILIFFKEGPYLQGVSGGLGLNYPVVAAELAKRYDGQEDKKTYSDTRPTAETPFLPIAKRWEKKKKQATPSFRQNWSDPRLFGQSLPFDRRGWKTDLKW